MKAIVYEKYGNPNVLGICQIAEPIPEDDEVLIKVHAVSINDWDWGLLLGTSFVDRLLFGLTKPKRKVLGSDVAGRIVAIGKRVTLFKQGDEVYGDLSGRWGGFAEYVCAPEKSLALKPKSMSFVEAAAIPQAAMLAVQGLIDTGNIRGGRKVLINGAGGGVGTFAIQIAKPFGVEITSVDSAGKLPLLRSLGSDYVIDYASEDFTRNGLRYDLILDAKTNRSAFAYLRALSPGGTYTTVGGSIPKLFQIMLLAPLIRLFTGKQMRIVMLKPNKDLAYIGQLFDAGKLRPVVDDLRTLEQTPEAMEYFGRAQHKGKVVITLE